MKNLLALLFVVAVSSVTFAQDFENKGNYITIGYGVDLGGRPGTGTIVHKGIGLGPIMATYERGITDVLGIGRIGVGGGVAFSIYNYNSSNNNNFFSNEYKYSTNRISLFVRAAYHFEFDIENLDVYAGVGGGVNIDNTKEEYFVNNNLQSNAKRSNVGGVHYIFGGARWYFSKAFGVYVEVGDGISNVNGGVVFSL